MTNATQFRYNLEKRLGAGAMGEVWLATDTLLSRPVAIKYLTATDDPRLRELFLSEARTLARLNHPKITLIYDAMFDEARNRFHLVMEYVKGQALSDIIEGWNGPLPLELTLDMVIGIVEALDYAHQQGIVHRDIKPANVLIQKEGVKLTDFGIASLVSLLTEGSEFIIGTPAYISPEQIEGGAVDARADLYALGVMLFEMISGGIRPFNYSTQTKLFMAHLQEAPPNIRLYAPDIPLALERAVMRLLAKEPGNRYPSAAALLEILRSIQARQKFNQPNLQLLSPDIKPFIGRVNELQQMKSLWQEVQDTARPGLIMVEGPTGSGKTRLVTEFLGQAVVDSGYLALAGRSEETGPPYGPYAEILATLLNQNLAKTPLPQDKLDELLQQMPNLARLLNIADKPAAKEPVKPEPSKAVTATGGLWQALTERVPTTQQAPVAQDWQLSETILSLLNELGPTAIFLEDAIYLDEASAGLTRFLVRQESLPLLIIVTCRDAGSPPAWLTGLGANEKVSLTLPPLTTQEIEAHLENLLDGKVSGEVIALIEERSRGNPAEIEAILRPLLDSAELQRDEQDVWHYLSKERLADAFLPDSVLGAFARRLDKLSQRSREALTLAALLEAGPEFEIDLWATVLAVEMPGQAAQEIVTEALKHRLLRQIDDKRYAFRPADVDKALLATLTGSRRLELHQRLAALLGKAGADPLLVAYHHEQAGSVSDAARYLQEAAAKAKASDQTEIALSYVQRAATLVESRSTYQALGDLQREQGHHGEAARAYEHSIALARQAKDVSSEAHALNSLSLTLCLNNQYQKAQQHAENVLKLDSVSETERGLAQSHLGFMLWLSGHLTEAEGWCRQAITSLTHAGPTGLLAEARYRLGLIHISQGQFNKARTTLQEAANTYRTLQESPGAAHCLVALAWLVIERGDFGQAAKLLDAAAAIFERIHHDEGLLTVEIEQGRMLLYQGNLSQTLVSLDRAHDTVKEIGEQSTYRLGDLYNLMAQAHLRLGQLETAQATANDALRLVEGAGNRALVASAQATLAQIYAGQGDSAAAEIMYRDALELLEQVGSRPALLRAKQSYAGFLRKQGQIAAADRVTDEVRTEAGRLAVYLG